MAISVCSLYAEQCRVRKANGAKVSLLQKQRAGQQEVLRRAEEEHGALELQQNEDRTRDREEDGV